MILVVVYSTAHLTFKKPLSPLYYGFGKLIFVERADAISHIFSSFDPKNNYQLLMGYNKP